MYIYLINSYIEDGHTADVIFAMTKYCISTVSIAPAL